MEKENFLTDWLTTDKFKFASKITKDMDRVYHSHAFYEFFYILNGNIKHKLNNDEEVVLQTGDLMFINLNDKHIFLREENNNCEHRDIVIRVNYFEEICQNISPTFLDDLISGKISNKVNISTNRITELENKLNNIEQLIINDNDRALTAIKFICYELCSLLYEKTTISEKTSYPSWFYELLDRFNDIDLLKQGLQEILKPFYYAKEHICRLFKKYTNMTMTDYLNQKRVLEAANMLLYTRKSIHEIYSSLGISSASYFNKVFKNQYHMTPMKFRKQSRSI